MSWSAYMIAKPEDVEQKLADLQPPGEPFAERDDQVKAAKAAALALVKSGAVGDGEAFQVSIGGHANTDHKPAQGWANDTVSASVSQVSAAQVDTYETQQKSLQ